MILRLTPVVLSLLLLAAHYLRDMKMPMIALMLAVLVLVFVPRDWARRTVRVVLTAGGVIWLLTASSLMAARQALDEPWMRMFVILGSVAVFTFWSAWLMGRPRVRAWYAPAADDAAED